MPLNLRHTLTLAQWIRIMPALLGTLLLASLAGAQTGGFHQGGAGECSGCHAMHRTGTLNSDLLLATDPGSICLNCHAGVGGPNSPNVFSPNGSALTPGGDFYWLTRDFSWLGGSSPGYEHGHNVVAIDYGLHPDPVRSQAPGGSYPSADLSCISCHDPHGRVAGGTLAGSAPVTQSGSYGAASSTGTTGNYRLLGDAAYQPPGGAGFVNAAPVARQSSLSKYAESDSSHVDYGSGMGAWCANCHSNMESGSHKKSGGTFQHPLRPGLSSGVIAMYNSYVSSGDLSGGSATAYLQFVPFERSISDPQLLDPHSTQGPDANDRLMCLSCHRAHASAFPHAGRWDFSVDLLVNSHPAIGDTGATADDVYYSYYGRDIATEFGAGQGPFCEKCHGVQ